jgi:hypothetical protein
MYINLPLGDARLLVVGRLVVLGRLAAHQPHLGRERLQPRVVDRLARPATSRHCENEI